jgi:predicted nucleic acid-binding protein
MVLVLDCSVVASFLFEDERHPYSLRAQQDALKQEVFVPTLFWHEMVNVLLIRERRGKLQKKEGLQLLHILEQEALITASEIPHRVEYDLAQRHQLTAYDAAYLALAKEKQAKLATLDNSLKKAAISENLYYNPDA